MIIERLETIFSKFFGLAGYQLLLIILLILVIVLLVLKGVKK